MAHKLMQHLGTLSIVDFAMTSDIVGFVLNLTLAPLETQGTKVGMRISTEVAKQSLSCCKLPFW